LDIAPQSKFASGRERSSDDIMRRAWVATFEAKKLKQIQKAPLEAKKIEQIQKALFMNAKGKVRRVSIEKTPEGKYIVRLT